MTRLGNQVRLSAISGIQSTLQILFVMAVMIPARVILSWVLRRRAAVDWKASLVVGCSIATLWYIGVCVSTFVDLRRETARGRELRQSFPASALIAGIYGVSVVFSAVIAIGMNREGDPIGLQFIPLVFGLIAFYGWPRTIHCDGTGVWQRTRFGQKRYIPFDDVVAVAYAEGSTTVTGSQVMIEHTPYHAGTERFQAVLSKRSGKEKY